MGFSDWFSFKSKAEREREQRAYDRWAFPYGDAQKQKVMDIVRQLLPEEDVKAAMAVYLMGREGYQGSVREDDEVKSARTEERKLERTVYMLGNHLPGRYRKLMSRYIALIQADAAVDETLNYPSVEKLREKAKELDVILRK